MQKVLPLADITLSHAFRVRQNMDMNLVEEYAEAMKAKNVFPPIDVFKIGKDGHLLVDGWHRFHAARKNEAKTILSTIHEGDESDALKFALLTNAKHGLRRSNADKRRCVQLALEHWPDITNRALSDVCGVSHTFVNKVRAIMDPPKEGEEPKPEEPAEEPAPEPPKKKEKPLKPVKILDRTGYPIPEKALEYWDRAGEVQQVITYVDAVYDSLKQAQVSKDLLWNEVVFASAFAEISRLLDNIQTAVPYAVCTNCQGKLTESCTLCGGKGLISKFRWDTVVPKEIKEMRKKGES